MSVCDWFSDSEDEGPWDTGSSSGCSTEAEEVVIPEVPKGIIISKEEEQNLVRNSAYYERQIHFEKRVPEGRVIYIYRTGDMKIPEGLSMSSCIYLIALNTVADFSLPYLEGIGMYKFISVCDYFGFDNMLSKMIDRMLTVDFRHALEFWSVMEKVNSVHPLIKKIRDPLIYKYFLYVTGYHGNAVMEACQEIMIEIVLRRRVNQHGDWLRYITQILVQCPAVRAYSFVPLCPICCELVMPSSNGTTTECCREPIHESCWHRHRGSCAMCPICSMDVEQLQWFRMDKRVRGQNVNLYSKKMNQLCDLKFKSWVPCVCHHECKVFVTPESNMVVHRGTEELEAVQMRGAAAVVAFHQDLRNLTMQHGPMLVEWLAE